RVTSAPDPYEGMERLVESYGLGDLVPNTIIMGDTENEEMIDKYSRVIASFHSLNRNVVIIHDNKDSLFGKRRIIDVWWGGLQGNGGLLMILAHLLKSSHAWRNATIRIKMVVHDEQGVEKAKTNLSRILHLIRIKAETNVLLSNGRAFRDILAESSKNADLIFLGMAQPDENFSKYYLNLHRKLDGLPTTALVLAASDNTFGDVLRGDDVID
ncbi:Na-K-Cl cotransporter, partial [Balneolaceae bacterium ANBcel3]|nr:Na-K-Cl cotransporter [Balneolaceae bacterium ANBcel3]